MDKMNLNKYCVIEVLDPPYTDFDKYICVPSSWISSQETLAEDAVIVKFPIENLSNTKKRAKKGEKCSPSWPAFTASIKYSTNSYQSAQVFIKEYKKKQFKKIYATNDGDGAASSSVINKTSPNSVLRSNINKANTFVALSGATRPAVNRKELVRECNKKPSKKLSKVSESDNSANSKEQTDGQTSKLSPSFKMLSQAASKKALNENDMAQEISNGCNERSVNANSSKSGELIASPPLMLTNESISIKRFVDSLKKIHARFVKCYTLVDDLRSECLENCTSMEQMINQLDESNNLTNSDVPASITVISEGIKGKQNETMEMETEEETVSNISEKHQEPEIDHRNWEDEKNLTEVSEETSDANENNPESTNKNKTISNKVRRQACKFILPKEYDENDSRWSLKHRKMKKSLVELIPNSRVYINAISLSNCKRKSRDSKTLARMLLVEVFSENALRTCSLTGKRANAFHTDETNTRPGLDEHAINVLLNFVEQYANEKKWVKTDNQFICNSIRSKLQEIRGKARKRSKRLT